MEGKEFKISPHLDPELDKLLPPRWDFMSSILYALSILTTTGYGPTSPMTPLGQFLSIGYGLIGIPLMVLAAVDIGRFLSDMVLLSYAKAERARKRLSVLFGCPRKANVITQVETKALKVLQPKIRRKSKSDQQSVKSAPGPDVPAEAGPVRPKKRLPLWVNAAILLLFCMFGGLVYIAAGLAVLSMCADLAASELKWIFLKIHYFGRKINWKRRSNKKEDQLEVEVKELLKIINQIRARYPEKHQITSDDILQYMQELNGVENPYTYLSLFYRQHRRDTIAFMPQSIEALKFADDMDLDDTTSHWSVANDDDERHTATWDHVGRPRLSLESAIELSPFMSAYFV
ncbi:Protein TWK-47 [Aphelenchoides avenae]|nr:Protein TWK-47 [Aphelenchus avenae]